MTKVAWVKNIATGEKKSVPLDEVFYWNDGKREKFDVTMPFKPSNNFCISDGDNVVRYAMYAFADSNAELKQKLTKGASAGSMSLRGATVPPRRSVGPLTERLTSHTTKEDLKEASTSKGLHGKQKSKNDAASRSSVLERNKKLGRSLLPSPSKSMINKSKSPKKSSPKKKTKKQSKTTNKKTKTEDSSSESSDDEMLENIVNNLSDDEIQPLPGRVSSVQSEMPKADDASLTLSPRSSLGGGKKRPSIDKMSFVHEETKKQKLDSSATAMKSQALPEDSVSALYQQLADCRQMLADIKEDNILIKKELKSLQELVKSLKSQKKCALKDLKWAVAGFEDIEVPEGKIFVGPGQFISKTDVADIERHAKASFSTRLIKVASLLVPGDVKYWSLSGKVSGQNTQKITNLHIEALTSILRVMKWKSHEEITQSRVSRNLGKLLSDQRKKEKESLKDEKICVKPEEGEEHNFEDGDLMNDSAFDLDALAVLD